MSADNLIRIKKNKVGLYRVTHESASSLIHAMNNVEPTKEELTMSVIANDIDNYEDALILAENYQKEIEEDGGEVEYGIVNGDWRK